MRTIAILVTRSRSQNVAASVGTSGSLPGSPTQKTDEDSNENGKNIEKNMSEVKKSEIKMSPDRVPDSPARVTRNTRASSISRNTILDSPGRNLRRRTISPESIKDSPSKAKISAMTPTKKLLKKNESNLLATVDSPKPRKTRLSLSENIESTTTLRRSRRLSTELNVLQEDPIREADVDPVLPTPKGRRGKRMSVLPSQPPVPEEVESENLASESQKSASEDIVIPLNDAYVLLIDSMANTNKKESTVNHSDESSSDVVVRRSLTKKLLKAVKEVANNSMSEDKESYSMENSRKSTGTVNESENVVPDGVPDERQNSSFNKSKRHSIENILKSPPKEESTLNGSSNKRNSRISAKDFFVEEMEIDKSMNGSLEKDSTPVKITLNESITSNESKSKAKELNNSKIKLNMSTGEDVSTDEANNEENISRKSPRLREKKLSIGESATEGSPKLDSPRLRVKESSIGESATKSSPRLDSPRLREKKLSIGESATTGSPKFESPRVSGRKQSIGESANKGSPKFESPRLSEKRLSIGDSATKSSPKLDSPRLREKKLSIGESANKGSPKFENPRLSEKRLSIGESATKSSPKLDSPRLREKKLSIGEYANKGSPKFESPRVSGRKQSIGESSANSNSPKSDFPKRNSRTIEKDSSKDEKNVSVQEITSPTPEKFESPKNKSRIAQNITPIRTDLNSSKLKTPTPKNVKYSEDNIHPVKNENSLNTSNKKSPQKSGKYLAVTSTPLVSQKNEKSNSKVDDGSTDEEDSDDSNEVNVDSEEDELKIDLLDDEAVDAGSDYRSGDSMDEEERQEMDENEIVEKGVSLNTDDTLSSDDSYEKDSFVVSSDEEDDALLSGSGDDLGSAAEELDQSKKSKEKFNAKELKKQKRASREMFEARHEADKSEASLNNSGKNDFSKSSIVDSEDEITVANLSHISKDPLSTSKMMRNNSIVSSGDSSDDEALNVVSQSFDNELQRLSNTSKRSAKLDSSDSSDSEAESAPAMNKSVSSLSTNNKSDNSGNVTVIQKTHVNSKPNEKRGLNKSDTTVSKKKVDSRINKSIGATTASHNSPGNMEESMQRILNLNQSLSKVFTSLVNDMDRIKDTLDTDVSKLIKTGSNAVEYDEKEEYGKKRKLSLSEDEAHSKKLKTSSEDVAIEEIRTEQQLLADIFPEKETRPLKRARRVKSNFIAEDFKQQPQSPKKAKVSVAATSKFSIEDVGSPAKRAVKCTSGKFTVKSNLLRNISAETLESTTKFSVICTKPHPKRAMQMDERHAAPYRNFREEVLYGQKIKRETSEALSRKQQKLKAAQRIKFRY